MKNGIKRCYLALLAVQYEEANIEELLQFKFFFLLSSEQETRVFTSTGIIYPHIYVCVRVCE